MDYATGSDLLLRLALITAVVLTGASILMLASVIVLRTRLVLRQRRDRRLTAKWRPLLARCTESVPSVLPALAAADREVFLHLWNQFHESLRGEAHANLNELARATGANRIAQAWLHRTSLRRRLIAVTTLGNLRDRSQWHHLRALMHVPSPALSLVASRALLRIDPPASINEVVAVAARRDDWPIARIAEILAEVGAEEVTPAIVSAIDEAASRHIAVAPVCRLLKLATIGYPQHIAPAVRRVLASAVDDDVIAACVSSLYAPQDVVLARHYTRHACWFVRLAAAKTLGRLAEPEDRRLLAHMLSDSNWWVRYRAAQSLAGLPFVTPTELHIIQKALTDRFAADILAQVIAERA